MRDVEQVARFQAPKYLACYTDVLALHFEQLGVKGEAELLDVTMMLELGVSRVTEVSLMAKGLSRTSAVAIAEYIVADDLDRHQVTEWVTEHRDVLMELPVLVQREIEKAFKLGPVTSDE